MSRQSIYLSFLLVLLIISTSLAQVHDKAKFVDGKNEFWEKIETENAKHAKGESRSFIMDFSGMDLPKSKDEFKSYWHNEPVAQGNSGMCWCFSTTSYFESEIYRTSKREIKLSELYTVYWEYVEKARRFVQKLGHSLFAQGSEANHVPIIWDKYGIVRESDYTGLPAGQPFHDHSAMVNEMSSYLQHVKENRLWDEDEVVNTIKAIMNYYIGEPPSVIEVNGKKITPLEYFKNEIKLNFDDYVDILSLMEKPYYENVVYPVPDNWWNSDTYFNIPLDKFMAIVKSAVRNGYSIVIGGDVSEPGYYSYKEVAVVPSFDIPSEYIDENARQMRFGNGSTTDDHGIHLVGFQEKDGKDWFLIKDSGSGSRNGANKGYYFYHEDYVKLKIMDLMIHKDALKGIIDIK